MKLKSVILAVSCIVFVPQMLHAMKKLPDTPESRLHRWESLQHDIKSLRQATEDLHLGIVESADRATIPGMANRLDKARQDASLIVLASLEADDEWLKRILTHDLFKQEVQSGQPEALDLWSLVKERSDRYRPAMASLLTDRQYRAFQGARDAQIGANIAAFQMQTPPTILAPTTPSQSLAGAGAPPPPPPSPSTSFLTPERKKYAIGAAIAVALGALYQKAPRWMKNRVKRILAEHDKTLADVTPAEQDLLIAASYARFNPIGSFFFQEAVLDMPVGETFREELWPVLYHVYYGKKRVTRKQARELRRLYDEAQELMRTD